VYYAIGETMTITVRLPAGLERILRKRIESGGEPLSEFVRRAIEDKLTMDAGPLPSAYDLGKHLFGKHASGVSDLGSGHSKHFREKLRAGNRG